jgi:polysaccharide deacetylase family protein (PEP-CTERM system associated)
VDVEDYFQVEAFRSVIAREGWDDWPARVVSNTERVLDILESANTCATFFVLGWVAERFPEIVRRISAAGHEVASHGYAHQPVHSQTRDEFRNDVRRAKQLLEDCTGKAVGGYRAPTFSITHAQWWAYEILSEEGHIYSSSIYPISHDLYGMPAAPTGPFRPLPDRSFLEIPIATLRVLNGNRPCGGGGYFRLLPYPVSRWSIRRSNAAGGKPCVFYCHPWEFDPGQPRIPSIPMKARIRHYLNIGLMEGRVSKLLRDFSWSRMDTLFCGQTIH